MAGPGQILREIHRLKRHIKDLDTRLEQGPRAHRSHQLKVAQAEEALKQCQEGTKQIKVRIHEKEVSIKSNQQNIEKLEKTPVTNKKEYDALRAEIKTVKDAIRKLEDEILDLMAESEEKARRLPEAEKALQKAKADAAQFEKDYQEKLNRWAEEKQSAVKQLAEVEASLPEDIRPNYERLVRAKGDDALAAVQNKICVACYTEVTSQMSLDLNRGQFVLCKNCGRILYMGEG